MDENNITILINKIINLHPSLWKTNNLYSGVRYIITDLKLSLVYYNATVKLNLSNKYITDSKKFKKLEEYYFKIKKYYNDLEEKEINNQIENLLGKLDKYV